MAAMAVLLLLPCLLVTTGALQEVAVIKALSSSIGDVVLECQDEMHFGNSIVKNFLNFWNEKNELVEKDMGCVLLCVFVKMELMDHSGHVQKEETGEFLKAMGADERVTNKIVELFQLCQRASSGNKEICEYALQMTKCFRYGIYQLHWAPPPNSTETRRRRGSRTMEYSMNNDIEMYMKDGRERKASRRRGRKDKQNKKQRNNKKSVY